MHSTRRTILEHLRDEDTASVEDLAAATALAPVTMRHHLGLLRHQGLVDYRAQPAGRGRPKHMYYLTVRGKALVMGDPHEALAARLVAVAKRRDQPAAEALLADVGEQIAADHAAVAGGLGLADRLAVATQLLSDEGFVVRWQADGDDSFQLIVSECPFDALCASHPEVCCMDQRVIERLVDSHAQREAWRVNGDAECVYRVRPASAPVAASPSESL